MIPARAECAREFRDQVLDFIATNPPGFGIHWLRPDEIAIRVVNWLVARDLFVAGFVELSFSAMAQTLVQLSAPAEIRGRVIGLFTMASLGLRSFSGITIGLVGGLVGNLLDERDKKLQAEAAQRAFETAKTGQTVGWKNPDSGHSVTVTPTKTVQTPSGYCRDYQATVEIEGKQEKATGRACPQPDGTWKIAGCSKARSSSWPVWPCSGRTSESTAGSMTSRRRPAGRSRHVSCCSAN